MSELEKTAEIQEAETGKKKKTIFVNYIKPANILKNFSRKNIAFVQKLLEKFY